MNESHKNRIFMREHSSVIRKWANFKGIDHMHENPVVQLDGDAKTIVVTVCRIRQRILQQAWDFWAKNTEVAHDYEADVRKILTRKLPESSLRTELEVEVMYKWTKQIRDVDPTGIAGTIFYCKKKEAIYSALQQLRVEFFESGETVLFQGDLPRPEDGHFTILRGQCEVLQFEEDSVPLLKLLYLAKRKKWDEAKAHLKSAQVLAKIQKLSGFGELSTLTNVKRAASIRACPTKGHHHGEDSLTEVLVLPKDPLLECLKARRTSYGDDTATSEAIDFMRQSGLANRISPKDLVQAAGSMIRRTLYRGDVLYCKGETVASMFLVVSGEILLDVGNLIILDNRALPFTSTNVENCHHMSAGSILGDEGVTGTANQFESTAVVVSEAAVLFEAVGFGLSFLAERIGALRYCALAYKDRSKWTHPLSLAEQINPYTYFHSLRKSIGFTHPFRGALSKSSVESGAGAGRKTAQTTKKPALVEKKKSGFGAGLLDGMSIAGNNSTKNGRGKGGKLSSVTGALSSRRGSAMATKSGRLPKPGSSHDDAQQQDDDEQPEGSSTRFVVGADGVEYPRHIGAGRLHRAVELSKFAKRLMQHYMKIHAKESILLDQVDKQRQQDPDEAELRFKKAFTEYRTRELQRAKELLEMEAALHSSSAIKFLASTSNGGDRATLKKDLSRLYSFEDLVGLDSPHGDEAEAGNHNEPLYSTFDREIAALLEDTFQSADDNEDNDDFHVIAPTSVNSEAAGRPISKLEEYFSWLDHLSRARYTDLQRQSQVSLTAEHAAADKELLQNYHYVDGSYHPDFEDHRTAEEKFAQLQKAFKEFGLTPSDLGINMPRSENRTASNTPVARRTPNLPDARRVLALSPDNRHSTVESASLKQTPTKLANADSADSDFNFQSQSAVMVPTLVLPGSVSGNRPQQPVKQQKVAGHDNDSQDKSVQFQDTAEKVGEQEARRKSTHFKTYTPSSWRTDVIRSKAVGLSMEAHGFLRPSTQNNRRVASHYYVVPDIVKGHAFFEDTRRKNELAFRRIDEETVQRDRKRVYQKQDKSLQYAGDCYDLVSDPHKFMEGVLQRDFPVRRNFLPAYTWNTRFVKTSKIAKNDSDITNELSPTKPLMYGGRKSPPKAKSAEYKAQLATAATGLLDPVFDPSLVGSSETADFLSVTSSATSMSASMSMDVDPRMVKYGYAVTTADGHPFYSTDTGSLDSIGAETSARSTLSQVHENETHVAQRARAVTNDTEANLELTLRHRNQELLNLPPPVKEAVGIADLNTAIDSLVEVQSSSTVVDSAVQHPSADVLHSTTLPVVPNVTANEAEQKPGSAGLTKAGRIAAAAATRKASVPEAKTKVTKIAAARFVQEKKPSQGMAVYEQYMNSQLPPRKFYDGKRKSNSTSQFRLEPVQDDVQAFIDQLERDRRSTATTFSEVALFDSLYPNCRPEQRQQVEQHKLDMSVKKNVRYYDDLLNCGVRSMSSRFHSVNRLHPAETDADEQEQQELSTWQRYTVESMLYDKTGPRMTLPVLIASSKTNLNNRFSGSKARRWGTGALVRLSGEREDVGLAQPPSYLDVYKSNFKLHSSVQEREKAQQAVHAVFQDRKVL